MHTYIFACVRACVHTCVRVYVCTFVYKGSQIFPINRANNQYCVVFKPSACPPHAWFLEIVLVCTSVCVCVRVSAPKAVND